MYEVSTRPLEGVVEYGYPTLDGRVDIYNKQPSRLLYIYYTIYTIYKQSFKGLLYILYIDIYI